jgi:hypothetical protein
MSLFDGVVTFDDTNVPVIIGLQEDGISMSSGGAEIGQWSEGEFSIDPTEDGAYAITAENETLRFVPTNPSLFAAGIGVGVAPPIQQEESHGAPDHAPPRPQAGGELKNGEAPAPKTLTRVAFYVLAAITAALGLWALVSLFL